MSALLSLDEAAERLKALCYEQALAAASSSAAHARLCLISMIAARASSKIPASVGVRSSSKTGFSGMGTRHGTLTGTFTSTVWTIGFSGMLEHPARTRLTARAYFIGD